MSTSETKNRTISKWVVATITLSFFCLYALPSCNEPPSEKTSLSQSSAPVVKDWNAVAEQIVATTDYSWQEGMDDIKACLFQDISEDNRTALIAKQEELDQAYWVKQGNIFLSKPLNSDTLGYINNALNHIKDAELRKKLLAAKDEIHNDIEISNASKNKKTETERKADYKAYEKRYKALKAVEKRFDAYGTNSYRWDMQKRMIKKGFTKTDEGLCTNKSGRQTYEEWEGTYPYQGYVFSVKCRWESMDAGYHYWTVTVN